MRVAMNEEVCVTMAKHERDIWSDIGKTTRYSSWKNLSEEAPVIRKHTKTYLMFRYELAAVVLQW